MRSVQIIEALLFASDAPLTAGDMARADESLDEDIVEAAVGELRQIYDAQDRAFQVYELAGGYQVLTRPDFSGYLERFATVPQSNRLSQAALEALAIIAYRQPIDRAEIEDIRGVASAGVLRTLQDRDLIEVVGRGEGLGRPMLYGTTDRFLDHFGFRGLEDLPREEELPIVLTERAAEAEEDAGMRQEGRAEQGAVDDPAAGANVAEEGASAADEAEPAPREEDVRSDAEARDAADGMLDGPARNGRAGADL